MNIKESNDSILLYNWSLTIIAFISSKDPTGNTVIYDSLRNSVIDAYDSKKIIYLKIVAKDLNEWVNSLEDELQRELEKILEFKFKN